MEGIYQVHGCRLQVEEEPEEEPEDAADDTAEDTEQEEEEEVDAGTEEEEEQETAKVREWDWTEASRLLIAAHSGVSPCRVGL